MNKKDAENLENTIKEIRRLGDELSSHPTTTVYDEVFSPDAESNRTYTEGVQDALDIILHYFEDDIPCRWLAE